MKSQKGKIIVLISIVIVTLVILFMYVQYNSAKIGSSYNAEDINTNELILAYRFRSFAWGFSDYVYLINADGSIKYVDIASELGNDFSLDTKESFAILDELSVNVDIPVLYNAEKISDSNINKIINIQNVKLKRNKEVANDAGYIGYYCVVGTKDERKMICIKEGGEFPRVCKNKNINMICNLIDDIVTETRKMTK